MDKKYRLCYISRNYRGIGSAGNKAKTDNEDTLEAAGAANLGLQRSYHRSKIITFFLDLAGVLKYIFCVRKDDMILLQYPVKKYFSFLCLVARWRGAKTIALIHDLGSFRRQKLSVQQEISRLMNADFVIASNEVMRQWLSVHGYQHPLGALGLFDYRSGAQNTGHTVSPDTRLVYAGGLAMRKNSFLLQLAEGPLPYQLHIFGNRDGLPGMKDNEHMVFHPFTPADDFISKVDADFGLVWDGDSTDTCSGAFGEYLRYNSPHKASFYIRARLPLIVWQQAAIAPIVEREDIGICIRSLSELETCLKAITPEHYEAMRQHVAHVADRLDNGRFLLDALNEAISILETNSNKAS